MAKLIILTGEYDAARVWADVWLKSHPEGLVFDEHEDEEATMEAWFKVEAYDTDVVMIPNTVAEIQLLEFAAEPVS